MNPQQLNKELGNIDLYLLDQILKARIPENVKILDAGCGEGRNLIYFLNNNFEVWGIDQNPDAIRLLKFLIGANYPYHSKDNILEGNLSAMPYENESYDYVICSAVLHFAESSTQFWQMLEQLARVLKVGGTLFIRTATDIGLTGHQRVKNAETYHLPDGSIRFLMTQDMIAQAIKRFNFSEVEPVKTVVVDQARCMTTLVFQKN